MQYVYLESEGLYTVGFYDPTGKWVPESDHVTRVEDGEYLVGREEAAKRVAWLNGSAAVDRVIGEAMNMGDGTYKP